jgi:dephospho-CoA kinase
MYRVGLTGGIGSGKSTVAAEFVRMGGGLVDTDALAHRLTTADGAAMPALAAAFGTTIRVADGSLNRTAMRQKIFSDPAARALLERILHPLIHAAAQAELAALDTPYALIAIPLLVETQGRARYALDRVLLVDCPEATQITRVMARNQLSSEEARNIVNTQATRASRLAEADDVLDNSGNFADLRQEIERLHATYCAAGT